ncbi:MAG TPA: tetratricopeptide repeat protein, partial [Thermoanaerobaculia bacterium]
MARRYVGTAILSLVSVLGAMSARAQQDGSSPRDIWPQATAAVDSGDFATADKKLEELLEIGKLLGIRRFPLSAESAAALARQANKEGNPEIAAWSIKAGETLDPLSPNVAFQAADLASEQAQWAAVPQKLIGGFGNSMTDYQASILARADLIMVLSVALAASAIGIGLILFTRYARSAAHDFREWIGTWFRAGVTTVVAFALLFLPIFLWLGPIWIVLYWFVLVFGYATIREKVLVVLMLLVLGAVPVVLDWNSARVAGIASPVMRAAVSSSEKKYHPEALLRLRDLSTALPDEPKIHLLLGNLEFQQGNESQALVHYNKAKELDSELAGAYVNIGNYQFLNGEFQAAINEYQKASEFDKTLAIAPYNHSVTYGELYKYQEQGEKLEEAKERDRSKIEKILANPPAQKIIMYELSLGDAWALSRKIAKAGAARDRFGNYATFDPISSVQNSLTLGSALALILAVYF